jgi:hypothetical protein
VRRLVLISHAPWLLVRLYSATVVADQLHAPGRGFVAIAIGDWIAVVPPVMSVISSTPFFASRLASPRGYGSRLAQADCA